MADEVVRMARKDDVDAQGAIAARDESRAARDKAEEWAENPEDTPVEDGQFSALHHAAKAIGSAEAASDSATAAAGSATTAGDEATAASDSATAAGDEATAAADSATAAATSAGEAADSATAAAQSAEDAETAANRVPDPGTSNDYIRGAGNETYERRTVAQVRGDLNVYSTSQVDTAVDDAVESAVGEIIVSDTDPGAIGAFYLWMDTSGTNPRLRQRNEANSGWINVADHVGGQWRPFISGQARETGTAAAQIPTNADLPNSSLVGTQSDHDEPEGKEKLARLDRLYEADFAVLEHGETSDGGYIRYRNGYQICWGMITLDQIDVSTSNADSIYGRWNYPRTFEGGTEQFTAHANVGTGGGVSNTFQNVGVTQVPIVTDEHLYVYQRPGADNDFEEGDELPCWVSIKGWWKQPEEVGQSVGSTYSGASKWAYGALGSNNVIYCAPFRDQRILAIDPSDDSTYTVGSGLGNSGENSWVGAVSYQDKIYFLPDRDANVLVLDTTNESTYTFSHGEGSGQGWYGGALADNGKIYCAPRGSTDEILVIDPSNDTTYTISDGSISGGGDKWGFFVKGVSGKLYGIPRSEGRVLVVDPTNDTVSFIIDSGMDGSRQWVGGKLAGDEIYCVPRDRTNILVINTNTDSVRYIEAGFGVSTDKWNGAAVDLDGNIHFMPRTRGTTLKIYTDSDVLKERRAGPLGETNQWVGAVQYGSYMYGVPFDANRVIKIPLL